MSIVVRRNQQQHHKEHNIDGTASEDKFGRAVSISGDGTRMAIGGSLILKPRRLRGRYK